MFWFKTQKRKSSLPSLRDLSNQNDQVLKDFYNCYTDYTIRQKYLYFIDPIKNYTPPKYPIVFCHGLSGFDQLILIPSMKQLLNLLKNHIQMLVTDQNDLSPFDTNITNDNNNITIPLPHSTTTVTTTTSSSISSSFLAIDYWLGIQKYLQSMGCQVYIAKVPSFGSIESRALTLHKLLNQIALSKTNTTASSKNSLLKFNLIAHSMGGLDCRYLISRISDDSKNKNYQIVSLTTISTPHRGSEMADFVVEQFEYWNRFLKINPQNENGEKSPLLPLCFYQLRTSYMTQYFNHVTPNNPNVAYFSYGAIFKPNWYNVFRPTWQIINDRSNGEPNDGMVTVKSSRWGKYMGTLYGLDHLDVINWQNKLILKAPLKPNSSSPSSHSVNFMKLDILQFYLSITHNLALNGF